MGVITDHGNHPYDHHGLDNSLSSTHLSRLELAAYIVRETIG